MIVENSKKLPACLLFAFVISISMKNIEVETTFHNEKADDDEEVLQEAIVLWKEEVNSPDSDNEPYAHDEQIARRIESVLGVHGPLLKFLPPSGSFLHRIITLCYTVAT
jgi:hypothetical protein